MLVRRKRPVGPNLELIVRRHAKRCPLKGVKFGKPKAIYQKEKKHIEKKTEKKMDRKFEKPFHASQPASSPPLISATDSAVQARTAAGFRASVNVDIRVVEDVEPSKQVRFFF